MTPGSPDLGTSRFKPHGFAASWAPAACYSVTGARCHTWNWTRGSTLCYSAGTRRLSFPQNSILPQTRIKALLPCQRVWTQFLHWAVIWHTVGARRHASLRCTKAQSSPPLLPIGEPLSPRFLTEERKAITCFLSEALQHLLAQGV
jgi:hypothetical protein